MLAGEEKEQEIENLREKIMKENFPNFMKEIEIQINSLEQKEETRIPKTEERLRKLWDN